MAEPHRQVISPADYDMIVENRNTGIGVEQTSTSPISQLNFWSIRTIICPEVYIHVDVQPGKTAAWNYATGSSQNRGILLRQEF